MTVLQASDITTDQPADAAQELADRIADNLTDLAGFIRDNPQLAEHLRYSTLDGEISISICGDGDERAILAAFATAASRAGRTVTKDPGKQYFGIKIPFGRLNLSVFGYRDQVCERVVTGVETVTREVPDPEALAAVPTVEVTETVEQVEWRCGPLLAERTDADR
jgi:hypothetical protein